MSKRPSLAETMRQAVSLPDPPSSVPVSPSAPPPERPGRPDGFYAATRVGKKKVTATLAPSDHKRLRQLALDQDMTAESLLSEAIGDLFVKYGQPGLATT